MTFSHRRRALVAALTLSFWPFAPIVAENPDLEDAAIPSRWIGLASGGFCPPPPAQAAPGCAVRPLFPPGVAADGTRVTPPGLADFCLYEVELPAVEDRVTAVYVTDDGAGGVDVTRVSDDETWASFAADEVWTDVVDDAARAGAPIAYVTDDGGGGVAVTYVADVNAWTSLTADAAWASALDADMRARLNAGDAWGAATILYVLEEDPGVRVTAVAFVAEGTASEDPCAVAALVGDGLSDAAPDLAVVVPSGELLGDGMWQELRDRYLFRSGQVAIDTGDPAPPVRFALADTHPTAEDQPAAQTARSPHGDTLLHLTDELLCAGAPDGTCAVHLTSRLALPRYLDPDETGRILRDDVYGGEFGTLGDLAEAIRAEVVAWQTRRLPDQHLVLNLSLGWDPLLSGSENDPTDMPPPVQAVHRALVDASCRGALIVAAAGNASGGTQATRSPGPWKPAAWEKHAAPDFAACAAALERDPDPADFPAAGEPAYVPLVHGVAGLQPDDLPLVNANPGSASRLAAFADHAVAGTGDPGGRTAVLTGSSVAALTASAAAAAVWRRLPELRADQVMAALYEGGETLQPPSPPAHPVDFCLGSSSGGCGAGGWGLEVRRLSICRALLAACAGPSGPCTPPPRPCPVQAPVPAEVPAAVAGLIEDRSPPLSTAQLIGVFEHGGACGDDVVHHDPDAGEALYPCADRQLRTMDLRALNHPAPGSVPCPTCTVAHQFSSQTLFMAIDPEFRGGELLSVALDACGHIYSLPLRPPELIPGSVAHVQVDLQGCHQPKLIFTVMGAHSVSSLINPLLVLP